ncbi:MULTISPECIES: NAD/NADP-dependent octopine/nopaline dehydrogenase family protein [unclassified Ensifer]|uniref:NAD/NADP-dependent octopine/nopaline dehydrogenase family protein n=1 Tax=unclassified Ensifer TaxID=2633371 RepID=UPI000812E543|nr:MULTISPECIES: NAD/NADP-dependent octopine/nopaline dehydrogenase family protein [unclassified Ensifer]OCP23554.1 hypothetical protein BC363_24265 [Ensifer sp. LC384]OCP24241.1 hypothetical protein BC361_20745 [Ensifer sp. LC54]
MKIAILGAGNGALALAMKFNSLGQEAVVWAPENHPGQIEFVKTCGNQLGYKVGETTANAVPLPTTYEIGEAVKGADLIFFVSVANAHAGFVAALKDHDLSKADLIVVAGQGYTVDYARSLNVRRTVETDNFPGAAKLVKDNQWVHVKQWKSKLGVSCFSVHDDKAIEMPDDLKAKLKTLFPEIALTQVTPLQMTLTSLWITHLVAALLNVGRLQDKPEDLPQIVNDNLATINARHPIPDQWHFYGQGMNEPVCRAQTAADLERLMVGSACGLGLSTLLEECNEEYGTAHKTLQEFATALPIHNVQFACPNSVKHRYFTEEIKAIGQLVGIARALGLQLPITEGFMALTNVVTATNTEVPHYTQADLVRFGATFAADNRG